jgi:hypothetical protein
VCFSIFYLARGAAGLQTVRETSFYLIQLGLKTGGSLEEMRTERYHVSSPLSIEERTQKSL